MISIIRFSLLRTSFILLLTISTGWTLQAQIAGGLNETTSSNWGGNNFISGTVFWPDGTVVNTRLPIKLQSMTKGEILATTDANGRFVFSRLSNGIYTLVIEETLEFESVTQEVEVIQQRNMGSQTFNVSIRLRDRTKSNAKPSVIKSDATEVPKKALEIYRKAVKLAASNDSQAAIEQLKLAIAEYPSYLNAFNEMGVQHMRLNELEKAQEALQSALKINPEAFEPLVNYGIVLFRLKKFDEAEPILRSALKVNERSPVAHYYLGRLLTNLERLEEAEKELKLALSLSKDEMPEAHRMLANLYLVKGDNKQAREELETYLRLVPNAPDAEKLRQLISQLKNLKVPSNSPNQKPK